MRYLKILIVCLVSILTYWLTYSIIITLLLALTAVVSLYLYPRSKNKTDKILVVSILVIFVLSTQLWLILSERTESGMFDFVAFKKRNPNYPPGISIDPNPPLITESGAINGNYYTSLPSDLNRSGFELIRLTFSEPGEFNYNGYIELSSYYGNEPLDKIIVISPKNFKLLYCVICSSVFLEYTPLDCRTTEGKVYNFNLKEIHPSNFDDFPLCNLTLKRHKKAEKRELTEIDFRVPCSNETIEMFAYFNTTTIYQLKSDFYNRCFKYRYTLHFDNLKNQGKIYVDLPNDHYSYSIRPYNLKSPYDFRGNPPQNIRFSSSFTPIDNKIPSRLIIEVKGDLYDNIFILLVNILTALLIGIIAGLLPKSSFIED